MTVDVNFGMLEIIKEDGEEYPHVKWPGIYRDWENDKCIGFEDDGTSEEFTIFSGQPIRSFSIHGFYDWIRRIPEAAIILKLCKPLSPETQDIEIRQLDSTFLGIVGLLPDDGEPCDVDRAKWFKYWAVRALEEFGEEAYISFS